MRENINAKIIKFKMCVPGIVSRNFRWRDRENGALKYKSCLVIAMDAKKRIERRKSLIWLADQTSCRLSSHKLHQKNTSHLKLYRPSRYKFWNFRLCFNKIRDEKIVIYFQVEAYFAKARIALSYFRYLLTSYLESFESNYLCLKIEIFSKKM